jgi:hypothetical protein
VRSGTALASAGNKQAQTHEIRLELHALRAGDELAGRTQHRPVRFNWGSAEREEFSELAERYVRAVCLLLAESIGDVAAEANVVNGKAAWDDAVGGGRVPACCIESVARSPGNAGRLSPREIASILSANITNASRKR